MRTWKCETPRMIRGALRRLAIGIALGIITVIHVVTAGMSEQMILSVAAALGTLALLSGLWFYLPHRARRAFKKNEPA